jgi:long-chain acyl-CoA synthetase
VDTAEVLEYAGTRLARFKCPVEMQVVDHLPHSVTGKVAKGQLRK